MAGRRLTWLWVTLLAVFFLWLSFRNVNLSELVRQLRYANPWLLLIFVAMAPINLLLRSWRWQSLLDPVYPRLPLGELFSATAIGYMAMVLPGRVGEVLRPALINRRLGVSFAPVLATVGVERVVLDLLAVLIAGAVAMMLPLQWSGLDQATDPEWLTRLRLFGGAVLGMGLMALLAVHLLGRHRREVAKWLDKVADRLPGRFLPRVVRWVAKLLPGFASLSTPLGMLRITGQTILIWTVIAAGMYAGVVASGVALPPAGMLVMLPILALGIALPAPGGVGTFHLAMKLGLITLFGVDETVALGAGLIVHAFNWLPYLAMGAWCVARGGLGKIARTVDSVENAPDSS